MDNLRQLKISEEATDAKCEFCGKPKTLKSITFLSGKVMSYLADNCDCKKYALEKERQKEELRKTNAKKESEKNEFWRKLRKNYKECGFTKRYSGKRLKNLNCEHLLLAKNFVIDCLLNRAKGLLFVGTKGNGKTTLAQAIAKELYAREKKVFVFSMAEYLNKMQQTYKLTSRLDFDDLLNYWKNADLLVIDDFGREKYTDKRLENVFMLFNTLYNNKTRYIITANPENIAKIKNMPEFDALLDRIAEDTSLIQFLAPTYRRGKIVTPTAPLTPVMF